MYDTRIPHVQTRQALILLPADRPDPRTPLCDLVAPYHLSLEASKRRPRGIEKYIWQIQQFIRWMDPDATIQDVTSHAIRRYQESIVHLSASTIGNNLAVIRSFCKWARRERLMTDDPTIDIDWPKRRWTAPKPLKPTELRTLLHVLKQPDNLTPYQQRLWSRNTLVIFLGLFAGLRLSEMVKLDWSHIDFDDGFLMVYDGKGGKDRIIPLHSRLRLELERVPATERSGAVLRARQGTPITDACIPHIFNLWLKRKGITCHPHQLRHTFATQILRHGGDLRSIQVLLGHESLETTMRYILVDPEQTRAAVDCLPAGW